LNFQARLPFFGTIAAANVHTSFVLNTRSNTLFTFVSTAGTGFS